MCCLDLTENLKINRKSVLRFLEADYRLHSQHPLIVCLGGDLRFTEIIQ